MQKLTPEQISACVDGEATNQEMEALVKDADAHITWARYHVIRDVVQEEIPPSFDFSLADRVSAAIQAEPTVLAPSPVVKKKTPWQTVAGWAVAASVFAIVVNLWQPHSPTQSSSELTATTNAMMETTDEQQQRLEALLINHTEAAAANGLGVMLPYARVVSERIEIPVNEPVPVDSAKRKAEKENAKPKSPEMQSTTSAADGHNGEPK